MKFDPRNLSLKTLTFIIFGFLILLSIIHYFTISAVKSNITSELNSLAAGQELGNNTYRILALVQQVGSGQDELKNNLKSAIAHQDGYFDVLAYGDYDRKNPIAPANKEIKSVLQKNRNYWIVLKANIGVLLDGEIQLDSVYLAELMDLVGTDPESALKLINMNSESYLNSYKDLSNMLIWQVRDHQTSLKSISTSFLIIEIVLFGGLVFGLFQYLIKPVLTLGANTKSVSEGQLNLSDSYEYDNELGTIQNGLNLLTNSLKSITNFVNTIGQGNLDAAIEGTEEKELEENSLEGALISMRDQMKEVQEEEMQRKWSTEGLAEFVEILRSTDTDVHELGNKIISKLVEYTKSNQGGIYLYNDDDDNPILNLVALYAYHHRKYDEKTIRPGEGLLGQTFLEKKTTYLLEFPEDYITIVSGLGGANPKAILIVPLMVNEVIYGIMELASFQEYKPYEIEFVEKLGESIASTISSVKANQRTKLLLEESQGLTEQMRAQEEEMRQNMEELTATQEEMARTEKELFAQQSAINENIGIAEFDVNGRLINVNAYYASELGYSIDELKGMAFSNISADSMPFTEIINAQKFKGELDKRKSSGEVKKKFSRFSVIPIDGESRVIELVTELQLSGSMPATSASLDDLEQQLKQQIEELDITQEQLDRKVNYAEKVLQVLGTTANIILFIENGTIVETSDKALESLKLSRDGLVGVKTDSIFEKIDRNEQTQTLTLKDGTLIEVMLKRTELEHNDNLYLIYW